MLERNTHKKQTCLIARYLLLLCSIPIVAVSVLAAWRPSSVAVASIAITIPVMFLAWRIFRTVHHLHDHAQDQATAAAEAERHYFGVLGQVVAVVEGRDPYLAGRSERIAMLASQMAAKLGLGDERCLLLGMVGRVHDIGLLSVSPEILRKATGLSGSEYSAVKKHSQVGRHMLQPLTFLHPVLDAVLHHHERMNGTGYPEGLVGEQIPIEARIMAVADSYDAMTHDRPHRGALSTRQAVGELVRCADNGYDRNVVIALAEIVHMQDVLPDPWRGDAVADAGEPVAVG